MKQIILSLLVLLASTSANVAHARTDAPESRSVKIATLALDVQNAFNDAAYLSLDQRSDKATALLAELLELKEGRELSKGQIALLSEIERAIHDYFEHPSK